MQLTERYVSDRNFPDKAIDAMDEAGSRVHVTNIAVPKEIEQLEQRIEEVAAQKLRAAQSQNFEKAASYRDRSSSSKPPSKNRKPAGRNSSMRCARPSMPRKWPKW